MRRASVLQAALLSIAALQLQSASGSSIMWAKPARAQALSARDIVEKAENFVKVSTVTALGNLLVSRVISPRRACAARVTGLSVSRLMSVC